MPPIHPEWLASSDQSAAISFRVAAKVISAARLATRPNDNKSVALVDCMRPRACSNSLASANYPPAGSGPDALDVVGQSVTRSPETDSIAAALPEIGPRGPRSDVADL